MCACGCVHSLFCICVHSYYWLVCVEGGHGLEDEDVSAKGGMNASPNPKSL